MSQYTSLGITVSPKTEECFLDFLRTLREKPDKIASNKNGCTALWENHNHFDEYTEDSEYNKIVDFLENLDSKDYYYESRTEDFDPIIKGGYFANFATRITYELYGSQIDLNI